MDVSDLFGGENKFRVTINKEQNLIRETKAENKPRSSPVIKYKSKQERRRENLDYTKNFFKDLIGREITQTELNEYFALFDAQETNIWKFSDVLIERDLLEISDMDDSG